MRKDKMKINSRMCVCKKRKGMERKEFNFEKCLRLDQEFDFWDQNWSKTELVFLKNNKFFEFFETVKFKNFTKMLIRNF